MPDIEKATEVLNLSKDELAVSSTEEQERLSRELETFQASLKTLISSMTIARHWVVRLYSVCSTVPTQTIRHYPVILLNGKIQIQH